MVKIRLSRIGAKSQPYYRVVVVDERKKRDGKMLEEIGTYNPRTEPTSFEINKVRLAYWRGVGAQTTEAVLVLLGEAKPKRHQEKNKQAPPPAAAPVADKKADTVSPEPTATEGAETVATNAPETTPEASAELAIALQASEQISIPTSPEVIEQIVETPQIKTEQAALQNEPATGEDTASTAESNSEEPPGVEGSKPSTQPEAQPVI